VTILAEKKINEKMTVREVCTKWPQAKNVFQKHGLMECGGPQGPVEPIDFFARAHKVNLEKLLGELNDSAKSTASFKETAAGARQFGYEKFLKAAILVILSVGCALGAFMIFGIGSSKSFELGWENIVQMHGHAQIFGWIGLFIMGIAYFVMPKFKNTGLFRHGLAEASFWMMLIGLILRSIAQPNAVNFLNSALLVSSAFLELAAACIFAFVLWNVIRKSTQEKENFEKFAIAGVFWFVVLALLNLFAAVQMAFSGQFLIPQNIDNAIIHTGLLGFAALMIFAVASRTLPAFMGLKESGKRALDFSFFAMNFGVLLMLLNLMGLLGSFASAIAALLEFAAAVSFVFGIRLFAKPEVDLSRESLDRSYEKFVKVAFAWLLFSSAMLFIIEFYKFAAGAAVEHAFVGAYRHALTVGFASMMIFGYATRIIPVFKGVEIHSKKLIDAAFWLVNIGNIFRVAGQIFAGFFGGIFFAIIGISGFIELAGIIAFGFNIWKTLGREYEETRPVDLKKEKIMRTAPKISPDEINKNTIVFDVLESYPNALDFFVSRGFGTLRNPVLRNTVAKATSIGKACRLHGIAAEEFIKELKKNIKGG